MICVRRVFCGPGPSCPVAMGGGKSLPPREAAEAAKAQGNAAMAAKDYPRAIDSYTVAVGLCPSNHIYFSNRSAAYLASGEAESAIKDAITCVSLAPDWCKGYYRWGLALEALEVWGEAIWAYEKGEPLAMVLVGPWRLVRSKQYPPSASRSRAGSRGWRTSHAPPPCFFLSWLYQG